MIRTQKELIPLMRDKKLMILEIFDLSDGEHNIGLVDFERNDHYDTVNMKLVSRLVRKDVLKTKDTSRCLELDETTIYLPQHEAELFPMEDVYGGLSIGELSFILPDA